MPSLFWPILTNFHVHVLTNEFLYLLYLVKKTILQLPVYNFDKINVILLVRYVISIYLLSYMYVTRVNVVGITAFDLHPRIVI